MTVCKHVNTVPFVIWCNHRSGSTHLSSLLASHPDIACWRELFFAGEGAAKDDYFTRSHSSNLASFLDRFFLHEWRAINLVGAPLIAQQPGAVGFKLKYQQVERYPTVIEYLLSRRGAIKVIHLIRENLLATLVSSLILPAVIARFNNSNVLADTAVDDFQPSVRLNSQTLRFELEVLDAEIARAKKRIADLNSIEVIYEDLIAKPSSTSTRLLTFLDLDDRPVLQSRYRKLLPGSPLDSISNGEEVQAALKGTRFEAFVSNRCNHG
jgi:Sulfotransferase family